MMRLDRFFSSQNLLSRTEIRPALRQGRIRVNGSSPSRPDQKIDPVRDSVTLDGKEILYKQFLTLIMNKPAGVVCATEDRTERTVLDLVPPALSRPGLFPAGRLDKDTTGLVLLTDDGALAHRILSPKNHIEKTYHAVFDRMIAPQTAEMFARGVVLADGSACMPAQIRPLNQDVCPLMEIIICEGKYHQVKRMAAACGHRVLALKRVKIAGLTLPDDLPEGACKEILHKDFMDFLNCEKSHFTNNPR